MRVIALLMSTLFLSGCVLTKIGGRLYLVGGNHAIVTQQAETEKNSRMIESFMLSCNNERLDWGQVLWVLKQQGYQQATAAADAYEGIFRSTFFYNAPNPLRVFGYPAQYFRFEYANSGSHTGENTFTAFTVGLPIEALARLHGYDGKENEWMPGSEGKRVIWSARKLNGRIMEFGCWLWQP